MKPSGSAAAVAVLPSAPTRLTTGVRDLCAYADAVALRTRIMVITSRRSRTSDADLYQLRRRAGLPPGGGAFGGSSQRCGYPASPPAPI